MIDQFWNQMENMEIPTAAELEGLNIVDERSSALLFREGRITEQYRRIWQLYQYLFGYYVIAKSGVERLAGRMLERGILPVEQENRDFYQKYCGIGPAYFYLRSFLHIERLSENELPCLFGCLKQRDSEAALQEAGRVVENTYRRVAAVKPESGECQVELFPSVYGEGTVPGEAIVIGMSSSGEYDGQGMLLNAEEDKKRIRMLYSVKEQLEPVLSRSLGTKVVVIVKI